MVDLSEIINAARKHYLDVFGVRAALPDDPVPDGTKSIVLLGPLEPGFWSHFTDQPEFSGQQSDPIDGWSSRVITQLAADLNGAAIFPFGGPPYAPFISWALRSGRAWNSPVSLLVHDTAGLFVSFRGAIALPYALPPALAGSSPCDSCAGQPCLTACPVVALTPTGYDLRTCHDYLETNPGRNCMDAGCAVRRACPLSKTYGRLTAQSAYHMKAFHK